MSARADFIVLLRRAIAPLLLCAIGALPATAQSCRRGHGDRSAGQGNRLEPGSVARPTILDELDAGAMVQVSPGATLVVLYLDAGDEYVFKGPATIDFRPGQPEMQSGTTAGTTQPDAGQGRQSHPHQTGRHDAGRDGDARHPVRRADPAVESQQNAHARNATRVPLEGAATGAQVRVRTPRRDRRA